MKMFSLPNSFLSDSDRVSTSIQSSVSDRFACIDRMAASDFLKSFRRDY